jgi:hypothetical protein
MAIAVLSCGSKIFSITENNRRIDSDEMFILIVAQRCVFRFRTIYIFVHTYINISYIIQITAFSMGVIVIPYSC